MDGNDGVEVLPVGSGSAESPCEKPDHETGAPAADNHLKLPLGLRRLLRRLKGSLRAEPVEELPYLGFDEYGDFFSPAGRECRRRTEVRLMVLEAFGQCKTFKNFDCAKLSDCYLSAPEWEALTIPMQTNAQLVNIDITWHDSVSEVSAGPYLQNLIRHSLKLESLSLNTWGSEGLAKLAAEVALALQPKLHHQLKSMSFKLQSDERLLLPVAEIISYAPNLESLKLYNVGRLDIDGKEAFSTALKGCPRLKHLQIDAIHEEMVDVLVEVYNGSCSDSILEHLSFIYPRTLTAKGLTLLICCNVTSIYIDSDDLFAPPGTSLDQWQTMGRTLLHPPTLRRLDIHFGVRDWPDWAMEAIDTGLVELWNASKNSPLLHIKFQIPSPSPSPLSPLYSIRREFDFLQRAMDCTYLQSLRLKAIDVGTTYFRSFLDKLASNPSIDELDISSCRSIISEDGWENLFSHLRHNTFIRVLILRGCNDMSDGNFRDMMDLLQVNFILEKIDVRGTGWETDGKGALIQEALARNKKQAGYFSVLGQAKLTFDGAKAGRVFLCGEPYAGKTTLKMTMMKSMSKKSKSESAVTVSTWKEKIGEWVPKLKTKRTQGIEVELLCENQSSIISIWDLAGQNIFRALHHLLFPRISQACIFVFVFNPFEGEGKNRMPKSKMQDVFAQELKSWLRFITSNTQITGRILPQVLVILTHKDKLERSKRNLHLMIMELEKTVRKLQLQYEDVVNLCPRIHGSSAHLIYQVNAKVEEDVRPITDLVLSSMEEELERKSSVVPRACSELVSHLLGRTERVQLLPLWPCEEFYDFCSTRSSYLKEFRSTFKEGRSVLHAVGSYMHDVGAICMTPSAIISSYDILMRNPKMSVVVDLNWLTQNLLGKIISCGHGFDIGTSTSYQSYHDGFVDPEKLFHLVEEVLKQNISKSNTEREMIKELLFELDLCYSIESRGGVSRYFMPILFGGKEDIVSLDNVHWSSQGSGYFGFRVQCLDEERTSFSPAFYPRFQIQLRKQMGALGVVDENFIFSRCYAEIRTHGCIIVVEIDESTENHIDIMVQFSKDQIRDWYMDFVQEHVVKDLIQFCASEKGCPGVQLVVSVLRTQCVERLTPRKLRTSVQAVLVEELKRQFQNDVEKRIGEGEVESKSLFGYKHSWPEISASSVQAGGYTLPQEFQEAQTLLSSKEVTEVLLAVKKNHEDLWQNLQELRQVSNRLNDPSIQLDLALHRPVAEVHISFDDSSNKTEEECESLTSLTSRPSFKTRDDVTVGEKLILRGMVHLQKNILAHLEQVKVVLGSFKSSVDDMCLQMSHVTSKVDNIIGCKKSKENHRYPRRPYFTSKDVTTVQKVKEFMLLGKAVRLHLMCEARHRPHFVENQVGLELYFEKDGRFSKSMRTLSIVSLHMIWILLKVGTQVTAGLGSAIPDISNLMRGVSIAVSASGNLLLDRMKLELDKDLSLLKDHDSVEEAWSCLRKHLAPNLTADKCASLFKLHLVRYRNSDDPYAWLCESCALSGRRNFLLEES